MKPMSPEERELEQLGSEVSGRYRAGSHEEPPANLDAAILAAARREVERPSFRRNWHLPLSIAALLMIGVSLALMTRDNEEGLPPLDRSAGMRAESAKPAAPPVVKKAEPKLALSPRPKIEFDSRPARERGARVDREADMRPGSALPAQHADGNASQPESPAAAAPAPSVALQQLEQAVPAEAAKLKQGLADSAVATGAEPGAMRKEAAAATGPSARTPEQWLKQIEELARAGKTAEVRTQLAAFRKRYPDYRLPEGLRSFEVEAK